MRERGLPPTSARIESSRQDRHHESLTGKAADALTAFEATLRKHLDRLNAMLGAVFRGCRPASVGRECRPGRYQEARAVVDAAKERRMRNAALCATTAICLAQPEVRLLSELDLTATLTRGTGEQCGAGEASGAAPCLSHSPGAIPTCGAAWTMMIDGMGCTCSARLKDGYDGTFRYADRRDVPITLSVA